MAPPNPFAEAIETFIERLRETETDHRSPFHLEVLKAAAKLRYHDGADEESFRSAQALQKYIETLDQEQTSRGKARRVGKKLQPLMTGLMQFTDAMDTMIQAGPAPAILIYGGAKLVLRLAHDFVECFDRMVDAMREIGAMLECYHIFSKTYDFADAMRAVLVRSYTNILDFWQKAANLFKMGGAKILLKGTVKRFDAEWKTLKAHLELDVNQVSIIAQALEGSAAKRREEETMLRDQNYSKSLQRAREQQVRSWLSGRDEMAQVDVRMDLEPIQKARHHGTGGWIFDCAEYQQWLTSTNTENLWLHADPGFGKSVLCATVIQQLQNEGKNTVYFFCSYQDPLKRTANFVLKSLALQLLALYEELPTDVERIFEYEARHGHTRLQNPTVILSVVQVLLKSLERVHIILDGLDECEDPKATTEVLLKCFNTPTLGIVKWFWASRDEPHFRSLCSNARGRFIHVQKSHVEEDIKKFVVDNPAMAGTSIRSVDEWVVASECNFLWLTLMLRTLTGCDLTCPAEVDEELNKVPKGLSQCYHRVLDKLLKRSMKQQELARRLFLLVAFVEQPLTLDETLDALCVDEHSGRFSSRRKPFADLVQELCCPLILVDQKSRNGRDVSVLRYFHKSTRDFFRQDPAALDHVDDSKMFFTSPEQGQLSMAKTCMAYLSDDRYQDPGSIDPETDAFFDNHHFLRYAALFWHRHFSHAGYTPDLFKLTKTFMTEPNFWTCVRVQAVVAPYLFGRLVSDDDESFSMINPDHLDTSFREYFATPLPDWLGDSDEGSTILQAYLALIREWNPVLLLQPRAVLECHPGVLGSQNIFSTKEAESPDGHIVEVKMIDKATNLLAEPIRKPSTLHVLGTQPTKSGLRIFSVRDSQEINSAEHILEQWHANLGDVSAKSNLNFKRKSGWELKFPVKLPFLQLRSAEEAREPVVWSLDPESLSLSAYRTGRHIHFDPPSEILQAFSNISFGTSSGDRKLYGIRSKSHQNGHHLIISVVWRYSPYSADSSDDDSDDFDDSDSDVSIDDSEPGSSESSGLSVGRQKSKSETCFCLVIAITGLNEPVWSSWQSNSDSFTEFIPGYRRHDSLFMWPTGTSLVQYTCSTTRTCQQLSIPSLDVAVGKKLVLRDLHFSACGAVVSFLTVTSELDSDLEHTVYSFSLETLILTSSTTSDFVLKEPSPKADAVSVTYTTPLHASSATISRSWTDECVYLAINSSSSLCTVKVLKLALPALHSTDSWTVQALPETIYVPASFSRRSPTFEIVHISAKEHVAFVLQPSTADYGETPGLLHPATDSSKEPAVHNDGAPSSPLPAIMITRQVASLGSWQPWDADRDGKEPNLDEGDISDYLKGNYAAADQRFTVPIRSGLNIRKAITVTCW